MPELLEYLNKNKVYNAKNYYATLRKNILYNNKLAIPVAGVKSAIYKIDDNKYAYANLDSLQGIGILSNGNVIIGRDRDEKSNDYYIITDVTDKINSIIESYLTSSEWKEVSDSDYINKISHIRRPA